mmetsp:Transcript_11033/g.18302  ORF Transcript_11033/g.18302 Transcript_11033/m.18302 type:complete len:356 (+) Transcript_11033:141-1208(+)
MIIDTLPETVLGVIFDYLALDERLQTFMVCRSLAQIRPSLDRHVHCIQVISPMHQSILLQQPELLQSWCNLLELDLREYATDGLLTSLGGDESTLPRLARLHMVSSMGITDGGLHCLSANRTRRLELIDITYCSQTTYGGAFPLRDAYPGVVIRRQPSWMDGRFVTPFDNDGIHTYWCDGSFLFDRDQQSCGHICTLNQWSSSNPNHVGDKLQYTNFVPPPGWPDWSRFCYRPGVSLLRLEGDNEEDETERHILVGQRLYGMRPPEQYPKEEHKDLIPMAASRYFSRDGKLLGDEHAIELRHVMVSRMKVLPLLQLMPPADVVERNRDFCHRLQDCERELSLQRGEEFLHHALNR